MPSNIQLDPVQQTKPADTQSSTMVIMFIRLGVHLDSFDHIYMITFLLDATYSRKIVYCVQL